jgi:predicted metal-dependent phosphoesterase TrpH
MSDGLAKVGIKGAYEGALKYVGNPELISRTHFARFLVESGVCKETNEVFRKYLTEGKPGFVPHRWASSERRRGLDHRRGGMAVIAHPARYKFTPNEEFALVHRIQGPGRWRCGSGHRQPHGGREYVIYADMARIRPGGLARQRLP